MRYWGEGTRGVYPPRGWWWGALEGHDAFCYGVGTLSTPQQKASAPLGATALSCGFQATRGQIGGAGKMCFPRISGGTYFFEGNTSRQWGEAARGRLPPTGVVVGLGWGGVRPDDWFIQASGRTPPQTAPPGWGAYYPMRMKYDISPNKPPIQVSAVCGFKPPR